jgi:hypothetical protein
MLTATRALGKCGLPPIDPQAALPAPLEKIREVSTDRVVTIGAGVDGLGDAPRIRVAQRRRAVAESVGVRADVASPTDEGGAP